MTELAVKYLRCSWQDRLLLLYTLMLLGIIRLILLTVPFRYIAAYLGKHMGESPYDDQEGNEFIRRVSWAIQVMCRYTPWESKCLVQAICGKILLRHACLQNTLYLGVTKFQGNKMVAHAWLRSGNFVVTGGGITDAFTIISKFADIGNQ